MNIDAHHGLVTGTAAEVLTAVQRRLHGVLPCRQRRLPRARRRGRESGPVGCPVGRQRQRRAAGARRCEAQLRLQRCKLRHRREDPVCVGSSDGCGCFCCSEGSMTPCCDAATNFVTPCCRAVGRG